jgi:hypothetical protein
MDILSLAFACHGFRLKKPISSTFFCDILKHDLQNLQTLINYKDKDRPVNLG